METESGPPVDPEIPQLAPETADRAAALEAEIAKNPKARAIYLQLSQLYVDAGRKDLAIAALERCLETDPKNVTVRNKLHVLKGPSSPLRELQAVRAEAEPEEDIAPPPPPPLPVMAARPRSRRPLLLAGAAVLVIVLGVVVKIVFFPSTRLLVGSEGSAYAPSWSPKGDRIAYFSERDGRHELRLYEFGKKASRRLVDLGHSWPEERPPAWSSDGTQLAYVASGVPGGSSESDEESGEDEEGASLDPDDWGEHIFVADAETGETKKVAKGAEPTFAPDGISLCYVGRKPFDPQASPGDEGTFVGVVNCVTGGVTRVAENGRHPRMSPRGDRIAFESSEGAEFSEGGPGDVDPEKEGITAVLEGALAGGATNAGQASHGFTKEVEARQYASREKASGVGYLWRPTNVFVVGAGGAGLTQLTKDGRSMGPLWSADGSRVLFSHFDEGSASDCQLYMVEGGGGEARAFAPAGAYVWNPETVAVTRSGRAIYPAIVKGVNEAVATTMTGSSPADLYLVKEGGKRAKRLENRHAFKQQFTLAPDGRRICYEMRDPQTGKGSLWVMRF